MVSVSGQQGGIFEWEEGGERHRGGVSGYGEGSPQGSSSLGGMWRC